MKKRRESELEIATEVEVGLEKKKMKIRDEQRTAAQHAMDCLQTLRRLIRGRTIVVVKDERTASQLRDFIVHGDVSGAVCVFVCNFMDVVCAYFRKF